MEIVRDSEDSYFVYCPHCDFAMQFVHSHKPAELEACGCLERVIAR
jgi:hypothetical protein